MKPSVYCVAVMLAVAGGLSMGDGRWPSRIRGGEPPASESESAVIATNGEFGWAFVPLAEPRPPETNDPAWCRGDIDRFVWAAAQAQGLTPAPRAGRADLLRRLSFDLTGLPPAPAEIEELEQADDFDTAWRRAVERGLASPRYGERWARHWLDLVRYAETDGHEFDPDKPHAFRFRDYVIEAFNSDLPYDQFVREQIAGDLLVPARTMGGGTTMASPVATGFWWLGQVQGVPVDPEAEAAHRTEDQLDVLGKAFLGLTISCARCHEHKFDPISMEDYYALAGYVESTQAEQASIDSPKQAAILQAVQQRGYELRQAIDRLERPARVAAVKAALVQMPLYWQTALAVLAAVEGQQSAAEVPPMNPGTSTASPGRGQANSPQIDPAVVARFATQEKLDAGRLIAWCTAVQQADADPPTLLYAWAKLGSLTDEGPAFQRRAQSLASRWRQPLPEPSHDMFADFERDRGSWTAIGPAFSQGPEEGPAGRALGALGQCWMSSGGAIAALEGRLISPAFTIRKRYLSYLVAGGDEAGRTVVNIWVTGQPLVSLARTGGGTDRFHAVTLDLLDYRGREARIELVDASQQPGGYIAIDEVMFSEEEPQFPNPARNDQILRLLEQPEVASARELARAWTAAIEDCVTRWSEPTDSAGAMDADAIALAEWALYDSPLVAPQDLPEFLTPESLAIWQASSAELASLETQCPESVVTLVARDGVGRDAPLRRQGLLDARHRGDPVPRRFLTALGGGGEVSSPDTSGRRELAEALLNQGRGLVARVIANRVWQHHFGRGLVPTSDNFGALGEPPSHPELLDYLANRLIESGWSLKALHRLMLNSAAFQQQAGWDDASAADPENRWFARANVRPLEAEALRDTMLLLGGSLDNRMGGYSVPALLSPGLAGRDIPSQSGPLDGDGRRSIYLQVRRNAPHPLLETFGLPEPLSTTGLRAATEVPQQALALGNDPFVWQQAQRWAARLSTLPSDQARLQTAYREALSRRPTERETKLWLEFLQAQRAEFEHQRAPAESIDEAVWRDAAHALMGLHEFRHVR